MNQWIIAACAALLVAACQREPDSISIQLYPAVLAADAAGAAATWDSVAFAGSARAPANEYRVAPEPLLTEWNITAFRTASQPDGSVAVAARINAYAERQLAEFAADSTRLKQPLGLRVNGRWTDFGPLLAPPRGVVTLYGLTPAEADALQRAIDSR